MGQSLTSKLLSWFIPPLAALLAGAGLIFLIIAVQRSTLPYNSEGNYFDGVVNYHEHSVVVYGFMAGVSFLAAVTLFSIRLLVHRTRQGVPDDRPAFNLSSK
jgi:phosphoglycerol transferase MdoB-like AlkP superfamily enzyme